VARDRRNWMRKRDWKREGMEEIEAENTLAV